jgi:hypothetical protein
MKEYQLTIRKVDPVLRQKILQNARLKSQSMNDWVLDAIRSKAGIGLKTTGQQEPSWKKFVGILEGEDVFGPEFFEDIEKIDEDMWK